MPTLVAPGVSVTISDESFYIPVSAPTVPLFFVATEAGKTQPNGITPAAGTNEHSVVRTVTSIGQSTQLYGIPKFRETTAGLAQHGDARNEYGLFALNQFLGIGNRAFVVRANVDLRDLSLTEDVPVKIAATTPTYSGVGNGVLSGVTVAAKTVIETITVTCVTGGATALFAVEGSTSGLIGTVSAGSTFNSTRVNFNLSSGSTTFAIGDRFTFTFVYREDGFVAGSLQHSGRYNVNPGTPTTGNGLLNNLGIDALVVPEEWTLVFTNATNFTVTGSASGPFTSGQVNVAYDNNYINFIINSGSVAFSAGDTFKITIATKTISDPLGANDAAKRVAIATALQAEINSNQEVRSELYEYNLILAPGYPEAVDELLALSANVNDEAFVIADTPNDKTPEQVAQWSLTSDRKRSSSVAYYYPWGLSSNLDGKDVVCAPSGIALRTYAYSDNQAYVWFAPAGVQRGLITGISQLGYVSGTLGSATTFVEANLNSGQRDNLYESFKNINPLCFFPGRGMLVWGQKTSASAASALDRVNVSRLMMYIKRNLRKGAQPFVFEPNDSITRDNLKNAIDGFLNDLLIKRGLYDFVTICDETNNSPTPSRIDRNDLWTTTNTGESVYQSTIDRNELRADVAVKPIKAAEFIYIPITVLSTAAEQ